MQGDVLTTEAELDAVLDKITFDATFSKMKVSIYQSFEFTNLYTIQAAYPIVEIKTSQPDWLTFSKSIAVPLIEDVFVEQVFDTCLGLLKHEMQECFLVDTVRIYDPHKYPHK